ncbi:hypothetical protein PIROE2DRAFT_13526 [Piromyces sp. E2]|nr:hypothetical protein PIROE2DRAFT_13526 [Piromyces sp. E2]|eukprot:OUM60663.1 hypothetical protein PIROE2DRAFT_13526 [Piromyces sp. E2]
MHKNKLKKNKNLKNLKEKQQNIKYACKQPEIGSTNNRNKKINGNYTKNENHIGNENIKIIEFIDNGSHNYNESKDYNDRNDNGVNCNHRNKQTVKLRF